MSHASVQPKDEKRPFQCEQCERTFAYRHHLEEHTLIHTFYRTGIKPFKCETCGKAFLRKRSLKQHSKYHETRSFECETCKKTFVREQAFKQHILLHHTGTKPFKCDLCGKAFARKNDLTRHELTHTGIKAFKCETCNKRFTCLSSLKKHQSIHTGIKAFECETCKKRFTQSYSLKQHQVNLGHTPPENFECDTYGGTLLSTHAGGEEFDLEESISRPSLSSNQDCKSNICVETLIAEDSIDVNISNIESEPVDHLACDELLRSHVSTQASSKEFEVEEQISLTSNQECKSNICDETPIAEDIIDIDISNCEVKSEPVDLYDQVIVVEEEKPKDEIKPFQCEECGLILANRRNLREHSVIHKISQTGIMPFKCETCDRAFARKQGLKRHSQIHGARSFECETCKKTFVRKQDLKLHSLWHSETKAFKCETCEKTFFRRTDLIRHSQKMHGVRSFECETCEKTFVRELDLKRHILLSHNGPRP